MSEESIQKRRRLSRLPEAVLFRVTESGTVKELQTEFGCCNETEGRKGKGGLGDGEMRGCVQSSPSSPQDEGGNDRNFLLCLFKLMKWLWCLCLLLGSLFKLNCTCIQYFILDFVSLS